MYLRKGETVSITEFNALVEHWSFYGRTMLKTSTGATVDSVRTKTPANLQYILDKFVDRKEDR